MRFSIITPSYRGIRWLPLCLASVADQDVEVEHIVQDAESDDGTDALLAHHPEVRAFIEKDAGMYDAINRGLRRSTGEILAYLNCDEQYLPGTLSEVARFFAANPKADVVFCGFIVTDDKGNYICSRKVLAPLKCHTRVCHLSPFSCGLFFRRRVIDDHGLFFDPKFKGLGDADWVLRVLEHKLAVCALPQLAAVYCDTGSNLGLQPEVQHERDQIFQSAPAWERQMVPLIAFHHRLRRLLHGVYFQKPFKYAIYTQQLPTRRMEFAVNHPITLWKDRFTPLR